MSSHIIAFWRDTVACLSVTIDEFWIGDRIYRLFDCSAWPHFTVHTHTHARARTHTHTHAHTHTHTQSAVEYSLPLLCSGFQRRIFHFLCFPQELNPRYYLTNYNSKIVLLITSRLGLNRQQTRLLLFTVRFLVTADIQLLISRSFPRDGCTCPNILTLWNPVYIYKPPALT
jgi:hypothetical protein